MSAHAPLTGEDWITSHERRAFEVKLVAVASPVIVSVGAIAAGSMLIADRPQPFLHHAERGLYPGDEFTMKKLGDPEGASLAGQICRKAMVDELPQAIDIIRGDMSLFGPRADKPSHIDRLFAAVEAYDPFLAENWLEARSKQKPGIISSYAIASHAKNLEGTPEYVRFSEDELLIKNALKRAEMDTIDFQLASKQHDTRLLKDFGKMVMGNYSHYARNMRAKLHRSRSMTV